MIPLPISPDLCYNALMSGVTPRCSLPSGVPSSAGQQLHLRD